MKYLAKLDSPFDYNMESYLYSKNILVIDGEIGSVTITIEADLSAKRILKECSIDIVSVEHVTE